MSDEVGMKMINEYSTPALLRLLAKEIEDDKHPSFLLCFIRSDDEFVHAHDCGEHPFGLLGLMDLCKHIILEKDDE